MSKADGPDYIGRSVSPKTSKPTPYLSCEGDQTTEADMTIGLARVICNRCGLACLRKFRLVAFEWNYN